LLLKQQWKCKTICHFVTNGEHLHASWGNEMKFTEKIEKELIYSNNPNL
jgi:hypothetical protein